MATSTCGKCGNTSWELVEVTASKARYKNFFIQCSSCGVPVGVLPYTNTASDITAMEERLTQKIQRWLNK